MDSSSAVVETASPAPPTSRKRRGHSSTRSNLSELPFWRRHQRTDSVAAVIVDSRSMRHSSANPVYGLTTSMSTTTISSEAHDSIRLSDLAIESIAGTEPLPQPPKRRHDKPHEHEEEDETFAPRRKTASKRHSQQPIVFAVMRDSRKAMQGVFGSNKEKRQRNDSLDDLEFDERPRTGFRYPLLDSLSPKAIKEFKIQLEAADDMRRVFNTAREDFRQSPRPEPRTLISRRLWGKVFVEMRKANPELNHFLDATYEDMEAWLTRALVPPPNNRPFMKKLESDLKKAWAESYFFGVPRSLLSCMPGPPSYPEEEDDILSGLPDEDDLKGDSKPVDPKKLSTTSSVSFWSFGSRGTETDVIMEETYEQIYGVHEQEGEEEEKMQE